MVFLYSPSSDDRCKATVSLVTLEICVTNIDAGSTRYCHYSSPPQPAASTQLPLEDIPHVTILRPVKGLEPYLYECLAATFHQSYPRQKLTIYFCVSSKSDPAYPILQRLLSDFPGFDAKIFVEEEDPNLTGHGTENNLGPNPKIRNMSRGYREAKGDIIWTLDCNVWIGKGVCGRMVDKLCGFRADGGRAKAFKFVHHLPLVVDSVRPSAAEETRGLLAGFQDQDSQGGSSSTAAYDNAQGSNTDPERTGIFHTGGGRLEEMFMASSHAKFYTAISTIAVVPCIVGKSNMFRRTHLDYLTSTSSTGPSGIDFFSENICEDHLIGDILWRKKVREEEAGELWGKHALVFGDVAIQPMAGMSAREYIARRVRWLRVRKWTVLVATLIEPGVECLLCSAYGSFALTTLPWFHDKLNIPQTWTAFTLFWILSVLGWITVDRFVYAKLHSFASVEFDADTPSFARRPTLHMRRPFIEWIMAWLGREFLALPIWTIAVLGGTTVVWRSKTFWVGMDMKVYEVKGKHARSSKERRD